MKKRKNTGRRAMLIAMAAVLLAAGSGVGWLIGHTDPADTYAAAIAPTPSPTPMPTSVPCAELDISDEAAWLPYYTGYIATNPHDIERFYAGGVYRVYESLADDAPVIGEIGANDFAFAPDPASERSRLGTVTDGGIRYQVELARFYDAASNAVREGYLVWDAVVHVRPCTLKRLYLPARAKLGAALRYGRRADAPRVAGLFEGMMLTIIAQDGEWLFCSRDGWDGDSGWDGGAVEGWLHMSEVTVLTWREPVDRLTLKAERVYCYSVPGKSQWGSLTQADCDSGTYAAGTCVYDDGERTWQSVYHSDDKFSGWGWIEANWVETNTFLLSDEVDLTGVVSATLAQIPGKDGETVRSETVSDERLAEMLDRLNGARAASTVYAPERPGKDDTLRLTLAFADGHTLECGVQAWDELRVGQVVYDLMTNDERADYLLRREGRPEYGEGSILGRYFDREVLPVADDNPFGW